MPEQTETTERLRKLDLLTTAEGRAVIERAIVLRLATLACTQSDCRELAGEALAGVCREWMEAKAAEIRAAKGGAA